MKNTEFVELVTKKLVEFLKTLKLNNNLVNIYEVLLSMTPEQKILFIRDKLKPYKFDLHNEIDNQLKQYGHSLKDFQQKDADRFVRFMTALIDASN
jgi:hypothetical protein